MKIALFGLPASGKGTQANLLKENYGFEQLSTGDMLRQMKEQPGPLGERLRALPVGTFADDALILEAVKVELTKDKYKNGVIFDGFPRTAAQAEAMLAMGIELDAVVYFKANEEQLIERGINRRVHISSGRLYNLKSSPPKNPGIDDVTGEPLTWREDDQEDIMRRRFKDFHDKTIPALNVLKAACKPGSGPVYTELDACKPADAVFDLLQLELMAVKAVNVIRAGDIKRTVTIESPYAGDIAANETYARAAMRDCLLRGEACFASHLLYTQPGVLDDGCLAQRRLGVEAGLLFAQMTAKTVVYGDLGTSKGMEEGIARAEKAGRPVEYRSLPAFAPKAPAVDISFEKELTNPNPAWATHMLGTLRSVFIDAVLPIAWRDPAARDAGYSYVSAETLYYALGGNNAGWVPHSLECEHVHHWVLVHENGTLLDPTWHQYDSLPDYSQAKATQFQGNYPSDYAVRLLELTRWREGYLQGFANKSMLQPLAIDALAM